MGGFFFCRQPIDIFLYYCILLQAIPFLGDTAMNVLFVSSNEEILASFVTFLNEYGFDETRAFGMLYTRKGVIDILTGQPIPDPKFRHQDMDYIYLDFKPRDIYDPFGLMSLWEDHGLGEQTKVFTLCMEAGPKRVWGSATPMQPEEGLNEIVQQNITFISDLLHGSNSVFRAQQNGQ